MLEPFEHRGLWWLPDEPSKQVAGVLTFSQDKTVLELIGQLPRKYASPDAVTGEVGFSFMPLARERILGHTTDGKTFTLEDCHPANATFGGISTESFRPEFILEGVHYESDEPVLFDELYVRYTQLDAWVATSGFDQNMLAEGDQPSKRINISFSPPEPIEATLPTAAVSVDFSWSFHPAGPVHTEATLSQRAGFILRFPEATPLKGALNFVYQLRNFVALGIGCPVTPVEIKGFVRPSPDDEPDDVTGLGAQKHKIHVFYRLGHIPQAKEIHPAQMLFTLADARNRFQTLLGNWFAKQERLGPVFDLYFGAIYNRQSFVEQQFLSLMHAIETYHRRTSTETDLPAEAHEQRLEEISAPEQHRNWLDRQLAYSNELLLRQRLGDVLSRCPTVVKKIISKKKRFVHKVTQSRNYLTHYNESLEGSASKGIALYPFVVQLQALIEMCLLLELGFDCDEIDAFFERTRRYELANMT